MSDSPRLPKRYVPGPKDESGAFVKPQAPKPEAPTPARGADELLASGLDALDRIMKRIHRDIASDPTAPPNRNTVQSLKDCMAMLHEFREKENDILDQMTDEEIRGYLESRKNANSSGGGETA